jgi:hypothetical protein
VDFLRDSTPAESSRAPWMPRAARNSALACYGRGLPT